MSRFLFIALSFLISLGTYAQAELHDSLRTLRLDEVIVQQERLKASEIGLGELTIDSLSIEYARGNNFAEMMRRVGMGQMRSNGPSGLSTPSIRGTGGSQTAILWNGINLQSPLSGQQDLSLIPIAFIDEVKIQKGGSASLYGSGAIGGSIQLQNSFRFNQGFSISSNQLVGSFGNHYQGYSIDYSNKNMATSTKFFRRKLDNDFEYTNNYVRPKLREIRSHSNVKQLGILQQNDWRVNGKNQVGLKLWLQDNQVNIPESILVSKDSKAIQNDQFFRGLLQWNYDHAKIGVTYKQAFIRHELNFKDSLFSVNSTSIYSSWVNQLEGRFDLRESLVLVAGFNHTHQQSDVAAFGITSPKRNNTSLFGSFRYTNKEKALQLAINFRNELIDNVFTPFSPSIGINFHGLPKLAFSANFSRNYRVPTFNDLYWKGEGGHGNPDLQTETSWNQEIGIQYDIINSTNRHLYFKSAVYTSIIDNWILWRPITASDWTPDNVKQVWSRGIESRFAGSTFIGSLLLEGHVSYNLTKTTNNKLFSNRNGNELNKQLAYTPLHQGTIYLKVTLNKFNLVFTHNFIGKQFTDDENISSFALPSYQILNAVMSRNFKTKLVSGSMHFEVNNLFNETYENRRGYPMYGKNFSLGITIQFNKIAKI